MNKFVGPNSQIEKQVGNGKGFLKILKDIQKYSLWYQINQLARNDKSIEKYPEESLILMKKQMQANQFPYHFVSISPERWKSVLGDNLGKMNRKTDISNLAFERCLRFKEPLLIPLANWLIYVAPSIYLEEFLVDADLEDASRKTGQIRKNNRIG